MTDKLPFLLGVVEGFYGVYYTTPELSAFFEIGVRDFCLMIDDNQPDFSHPKDAETFASVEQAGLANCLHQTLTAQDPACTLRFVPAAYSGQASFSQSLIELSRHPDPTIDLCYTGHEICSPEITTEDVKQFEEAVGRQPLIWDDYPVTQPLTFENISCSRN